MGGPGSGRRAGGGGGAAALAGDILYIIKADATKLYASITTAETKFKGLSTLMQTHAKKISYAMTGIGVAITGAMALSTKSALTFEEGMRNIGTLGVTNIGELKEGILDYSVAMGKDAVGATQDLYQILSKGASQETALDYLEASAMAAAAGVGETSDALQLGMSVMNAYGLKTGDATKDIATFKTIMGEAVQGVKYGSTTIGELGSVIGRVAPIASQAGISTKELFASLASVTSQGLSTAEAVTGIKSALTAVIKPTKDASDLAELLGIDFDVAALKTKGWGGFLGDIRETIEKNAPVLAQNREALGKQIEALEKTAGGSKELKEELKGLTEKHGALKGASEETVETMAALFGNVRGLGTALALTSKGGMAKYIEALDNMKDGQKTLQETFDEWAKDNPELAYRQMKEALNALKIEIGIALLPVLKDFSDAMVPILQSMADFVKTDLGAIVVKIGLAFGGAMLLAAPFFKLFTIFSAIKASMALGTIAGAVTSTGTAATGAIGAAGGAAGAGAIGILGFSAVLLGGVAAVGYLGVALYKLYKAEQGYEATRQQGISTVEKARRGLIDYGVSIDEASWSMMDFEERQGWVDEQGKILIETFENETDSVYELTDAMDGAAWSTEQAEERRRWLIRQGRILTDVTGEETGATNVFVGALEDMTCILGKGTSGLSELRDEKVSLLEFEKKLLIELNNTNLSQEDNLFILGEIEIARGRMAEIQREAVALYANSSVAIVKETDSYIRLDGIMKELPKQYEANRKALLELEDQKMELIKQGDLLVISLGKEETTDRKVQIQLGYLQTEYDELSSAQRNMMGVQEEVVVSQERAVNDYVGNSHYMADEIKHDSQDIQDALRGVVTEQEDSLHTYTSNMDGAAKSISITTGNMHHTLRRLSLDHKESPSINDEVEYSLFIYMKLMDDMYSGMWTVLEAIRNMWINVWDFIGNYAQGTLNWVLDMVSRGWDAIRDLGSEWFGGWAAGGVLQAFAEGGTVKHQMALVGERGPEAIALPNGTRVMPHGEMRTALGQGIAPDESENGDTQQLTNSITQLNSLLLQVGNRIGKSIEGIAFSTRVNANLLSIIIQAAQIQSKFINVVQQSNSLLTASIKSRMMESPSIQIHIDTINERSDVDSLYDYMMQKLSGDIATAQTT